MKTIVCTIIEWVGPRCSRKGKRRSASGRTDSVRASGIISLVFRTFAEALLERYAKAMWPTAYDFSSPDIANNERDDLISL